MACPNCSSRWAHVFTPCPRHSEANVVQLETAVETAAVALTPPNNFRGNIWEVLETAYTKSKTAVKFTSPDVRLDIIGHKGEVVITLHDANSTDALNFSIPTAQGPEVIAQIQKALERAIQE